MSAFPPNMGDMTAQFANMNMKGPAAPGVPAAPRPAGSPPYPVSTVVGPRQPDKLGSGKIFRAYSLNRQRSPGYGGKRTWQYTERVRLFLSSDTLADLVRKRASKTLEIYQGLVRNLKDQVNRLVEDENAHERDPSQMWTLASIKLQDEDSAMVVMGREINPSYTAASKGPSQGAKQPNFNDQKSQNKLPGQPQMQQQPNQKPIMVPGGPPPPPPPPQMPPMPLPPQPPPLQPSSFPLGPPLAMPQEGDRQQRPQPPSWESMPQPQLPRSRQIVDHPNHLHQLPPQIYPRMDSFRRRREEIQGWVDDGSDDYEEFSSGSSDLTGSSSRTSDGIHRGLLSRSGSMMVGRRSERHFDQPYRIVDVHPARSGARRPHSHSYKHHHRRIGGLGHHRRRSFASEDGDAYIHDRDLVAMRPRRHDEEEIEEVGLRDRQHRYRSDFSPERRHVSSEGYTECRPRRRSYDDYYALPPRRGPEVFYGGSGRVSSELGRRRTSRYSDLGLPLYVSRRR